MALPAIRPSAKPVSTIAALKTYNYQCVAGGGATGQACEVDPWCAFCARVCPITANSNEDCPGGCLSNPDDFVCPTDPTVPPGTDQTQLASLAFWPPALPRRKTWSCCTLLRKFMCVCFHPFWVTTRNFYIFTCMHGLIWNRVLMVQSDYMHTSTFY